MNIKIISISAKIISTIKHNRISATEVADAIGKRNVFHGKQPLAHDIHCVGLVRPVFVVSGSKYGIQNQVRTVQAD
jgi:hypothetical protein